MSRRIASSLSVDGSCAPTWRTEADASAINSTNKLLRAKTRRNMIPLLLYIRCVLASRHPSSRCLLQNLVSNTAQRLMMHDSQRVGEFKRFSTSLQGGVCLQLQLPILVS